jgi:hypothetical protein
VIAAITALPAPGLLDRPRSRDGSGLPYEALVKGIAIDCAYDTSTLGATWLFDDGEDVTITRVLGGDDGRSARYLVTRARVARMNRV